MKCFCRWMRPPLSATWVAFICALLGAPSARSQAPQQAPPRPIIRAIDVVYTSPATVSKERILAHMRTKKDQTFNDANVKKKIEALYKSVTIQNVLIFGDQP